jgi:hypothetical protein
MDSWQKLVRFISRDPEELAKALLGHSHPTGGIR